MELQQLPLFPLNTVLFPGMPIPLHIFEERYKRMIAECQEHRRPFGVVLIRSGQEVGAAAEPWEVGTTATIAALTRYEDGRMDLVAVGQRRFRIVELMRDQPYLVAQVTFLDDAVEDGLKEQAEALAPAIHHYLASLLALLGQQREPFELPDKPEKLSFFIATVLQIGLEEKQSLLELPSTSERLERERELLDRENANLATALRVKDQLGKISPLNTATRRGQISPN